MIIAVVSDIHSNDIAFEAVLRDIESRDVERIFFLGDYIFGGTGSNRTIDLLMEYQKCNSEHVIICGNIDELIIPLEAGAEWIYQVNKKIYDEMGKRRIDFLKSLKSKELVDIEGISIQLCHNPSQSEVFNMVDSIRRENSTPNIRVLSEMADKLQSDVCIFGHYHLFMDEEIKDKRFICPSSVGMPFNGDARAQYLMMEIQKGKISTARQFVDYDKMRLVRDFDKKGYFEKYDSWSMNTTTTILTGHNYIG